MGVIDISRLSPRQQDCLRLASELRTSKEIALELGLRAGTVDSYLTQAIAILGARNRREAALLFQSYRTPSDLWGQIAGVSASDAGSVAPPETPHSRSTDSLGARGRGTDTSYGLVERIGRILVIAAAMAIGFGALAAGVRSTNDLFSATLRTTQN